MNYIGPHTKHISRLYSQPALGSQGKKRIKFHQVICMLMVGKLVFLDISPFLKGGKQYGRCKDGHTKRVFIKKGRIWMEVL
jgi:hypothetical protein